jgi:DNA-binding response OmpR family regulator
MNALNISTVSNEVLVLASTANSAVAAEQHTILLVEDDRAARRYLEVILQRAGYAVVTAADGLEAMKAAMSQTIDAVVTDAIMPHLNGYELCRFFRRHPKFANLPIIILSGLDQKPDASPGDADACADKYLSKPVRPEELTGCIEQMLIKKED